MTLQPPQHRIGNLGPHCVECGKVFPCNAFRIQARAATAAAEAREQAEQRRLRRASGKAA